MKKKMKYVLFVWTLWSIILMSAISVQAAGKSKISPLEMDQWVSVRNYDGDYENKCEYKFTISKDSSYLLLNASMPSDRYSAIHIRNAGYKYDEDFMPDSGKIKNRRVVLKKGTYYLSIDCGGSVRARVKCSIKTITPKTNYTCSKAVSLKANRKTEFVDTWTTHFPRWYKIKVTKTKRLEINEDRFSYGSFYLYSPTGEEISLQGNSSGYNTSDKLKKGTYYLRVSTYSDYDGGNFGSYVAFKWN